MARNVPSASASRIFSSAILPDVNDPVPQAVIVSEFILRHEAQTEHDLVLVRQVAHQASHGPGNDLIKVGNTMICWSRSHFRLLIGVDHLQLVVAVQTLFADRLDIFDRLVANAESRR